MLIGTVATKNGNFANCGLPASTQPLVSMACPQSLYRRPFTEAQINLDRKILADIAVRDPDGFTALCEQARQAL